MHAGNAGMIVQQEIQYDFPAALAGLALRAAPMFLHEYRTIYDTP